MSRYAKKIQTGLQHVDEYWNSFRFIYVRKLGGRKSWDDLGDQTVDPNGTFIFGLKNPAVEDEKLILHLGGHAEHIKLNIAFCNFLKRFIVAVDPIENYIKLDMPDGDHDKFWSIYDPTADYRFYIHKDHVDLAKKLLQTIRDTSEDSATRVVTPMAEKIIAYLKNKFHEDSFISWVQEDQIEKDLGCPQPGSQDERAIVCKIRSQNNPDFTVYTHAFSGGPYFVIQTKHPTPGLYVE